MVDYVNRGPDERVADKVPILRWLAPWLQQTLSYHSTTPPKVKALWREKKGGPGHVAVCQPPFFTMAVPKSNGSYFTFRIGWRWDLNWPGYIADVILKTRMQRERVVVP